MPTPLLYLKDAHVTFGGSPLFTGISLQIMQGDKICLVGRNGSGKSTLLKVISGDVELDSGERYVQPGIRIGHLPQNVIFVPGETVRDYVLAGLDGHHTHEGEDNSYRVDMVITPLNLKPHAPMDKLSGGKLRRAGLARALVSNPDILLLDEPTNHLDLAAIEWLEGYVQQYNGGLVCISHDRSFLEHTSSKTFWLDRGKMRSSDRGYSQFEAWSDEVMEAEQKMLERMDKKLEAENHWLAYGVTARRKRNQRRLGDLITLRGKLRADHAHFRTLSATIKLPPLGPDQSSKIVAEVKELSKSFDDVDPPKLMIRHFSTRIMRGDRIGIIGRNGAGKTTFLKLLLGELEPSSGRIRMGKNLSITYFDQKRESLDPKRTLWQTLCSEGDTVMVRGEPRHVVGYLRDFLFSADQVRSPVGSLSGGECNRLLLAQKLANPGNVLILDEPTNDLDMDSLDVLQEVLSDYEGTLLIVSHDRDFIDRLVMKTIVFEGNGEVQEYIGGYSDYMAQKKEAVRAAKAPAKLASVPGKLEQPTQPLSKMSYKYKRELELLPERMETLEKDIAALEIILADPDLYTNNAKRFDEASARLMEKKAELEQAEERWLELEEMRGSL